MAEHEIQILRGHELRLLRCTLRPPPSNSSPSFQSLDSTASPSPLHALISNILTSIESGDFFGALSSDAARLVLASPDSDLSSDSPDRVYSDLLDRVESFINEPSIDDAEKACRVVLVLCVAVAAFFWFTRCNLTGPVEKLPNRPFPMKAWWEGSETVEWESWARNQLMSAGSDLLGKFSYLQYIVFAKMLLLKTRDLLFEASISSTFGIRSISWWLFRILLTHQRILDEHCSSLFDLLQVFIGENLSHFGSLEKVTSYWNAQLQDGEASTIVAMVHLEAGIVEYIYGRTDPCRLHLESAEVAAGLQLSVTGILGLRTVHQVEPTAQRVLVANTDSKSESGDICTSIGSGIQLSGQSNSEASDILMTPKLVENGYDIGKNACVGANATLTEVQQAVILAQCLLIEKSTAQGELQAWDMAPYIEAIDSQQSSNFILKCFCNILRIRWESTRSRTKQRALLMMESLVESIHKASHEVPLRIPFCYAVYLPTIPAFQKQYGEILVSCGLVGEALKIFEDLELWDNLIYCYCQLEKKAAAVEVIKMRLDKTPNDPKLWCSLGYITDSDACYEKALEVSNNRSARAKRLLARSAYQRGDYEKSKILWESAMALNSLYPNGWFALGAAALKARDVEKALDGFTREVQLDPENGEAWNNIACLHMIKKKSKESFTAFKEALKYKRDSWQMWENYGHVAFDVGNISQALEAIKMVVNMTKNKRIDVELLERVMQYLEERASVRRSPVTNDDECSNQTSPDSLLYSVDKSANAEQTAGKLRENEHFVELLGKILQQILRTESRADVWGLYARCHRIKGDLTMCCEALLKQVRSYQGSNLWKDIDSFKRFAQASLELCQVYMDISSSTGSRRELLTAEMHLKNTLKQAGIFSETEEFRNLEACLDKVKMKQQQSESTPI
ncbi:Tetratricopeptide-like helical [Corchorus capsularis]|uniref:Tetratricopeptide-like helical n=1 Tax=Corchorus capsularis TaxID=210143 RepID=A0A1R3I7L8_COCAP|nr:Tetratricopeptide-like helical [Corchorus capsularis]